MAMEINTVQNKDCMDGMGAMDGGSVDLVIADPPYFQGNGGGGGSFGVNKKNHRTEIDKMMCGISDECLEQMARVCKRVNMYIFCSVLQVPQYLAFATRHGYKFDILTWHKTNAVPACNGKYMPDTEYIVFIKESGVPIYGTAATKRKYYVTPTNVKDKRKWGAPDHQAAEYCAEPDYQLHAIGWGSFRPFHGKRHNRRCVHQNRSKLYRL